MTRHYGEPLKWPRHARQKKPPKWLINNPTCRNVGVVATPPPQERETKVSEDYEQEPPRYNWDYFQSDYFAELVEKAETNNKREN